VLSQVALTEDIRTIDTMDVYVRRFTMRVWESAIHDSRFGLQKIMDVCGMRVRVKFLCQCVFDAFLDVLLILFGTENERRNG